MDERQEAQLKAEIEPWYEKECNYCKEAESKCRCGPVDCDCSYIEAIDDRGSGLCRECGKKYVARQYGPDDFEWEEIDK